VKRTGKRLTLRGSISKDVNAQFSSDGFTILEYANVLDLQRAWKVSGYAVWPVGYKANFGADLNLGAASIETFLATDGNINDAGTVFIANNARDNRQIAWGNTLIELGGSYRLLAGESSKIQAVKSEHYWIDPEHLVQTDLRLFCRIGGISYDEGAFKEINYIVYLEEMEVTPSESIIQSVKSKAQDLSN